MSNRTEPECEATREWLSALRDNEAGHDAALASHADHCVACGRWATQLDVVTRTTRLRAPIAPASLRRSLPPLPQALAKESTQLRSAQMVLGVAAVSGVLAVLIGMTGLIGHAHFGTIDGRDAWGMKVALLAGFALAAWRPQRNAAGLLPIATIAALITVTMSVVSITAGDTRLVDEIAHIPILLGAVGAVLAWKAVSPTTAPAVRPAPANG